MFHTSRVLFALLVANFFHRPSKKVVSRHHGVLSSCNPLVSYCPAFGTVRLAIAQRSEWFGLLLPSVRKGSVSYYPAHYESKRSKSGQNYFSPELFRIFKICFFHVQEHEKAHQVFSLGLKKPKISKSSNFIETWYTSPFDHLEHISSP